MKGLVLINADREIKLTIQDNGTHELFLYGSIAEDIDDISRLPVVWGECEGGKRVTVFNLLLLSDSSNFFLTLTKTSKWCFLQVWVGDVWFKSEADIKLFRYSYGINNLNIWHNQSCFKNETQEEGKLQVLSYQKPDTLELYENDTLRIFIGYAFPGPMMSVAQTKVAIEHFPRIAIYSKGNPVPFITSNEVSGVQSYAEKIYSLFALLIGKHVYNYDFKGRVDVVQEQQVQSPEQKKCFVKDSNTLQIVNYYFARSVNSSQQQKIKIPNEILFPFASLGNDLLRLICKNWIEAPHELNDAASSIMAFRNNMNVFESLTCPSLIFAFEGLHRALHPELDERADAHKEKLLKKCPDKIAEDLRRITMRGQSLSARVTAAMKECHDIFPFIEPFCWSELAKNITIIRNNAAHSKGEEALDFYFVFDLARFVSLLMIALLMKKIAMPSEKIRECMSNTQEYISIRNTFQEKLQEAKPLNIGET